MRDALPGISVHALHVHELAQSFFDGQLDRLEVVSTCAEIALEFPKGNVLNLNRLFDRKGNLIGYGPRPGALPLREQFDNLAAKLAGRPFALVEDGVFTGGTFRFVLSQFETRGARPSLLALGFSTREMRLRLEGEFGRPIQVVHEIGNLVDWIADHDLVPFTPGCGRIIGESVPEGFIPFRTPEGCACASPYVLPFGIPEDWANLPSHVALSISAYCLEASIGFFSRFSKADGTPVLIRDLARNYPNIPLPVAVGNGAVPPLDLEVAAFLREAKSKLTLPS
jgi:hypothetical protein